MKRRPESFLETTVSKAHRGDVIALFAVPVALIGVFVLPYEIRLRFALAYHDPAVLSLYTANFSHLTVEHLMSNLFGYLFVVPTAYILCVLADRRWTFWSVFAVYLTVFPFVLSLLNVELSEGTARIGLGFSGVLAAFFGFLPLAILWYTRRRFTGDASLQHAPLFYFIGVSVISLIALPLGPLSYVVLGLALIGVLLSGHRLLADLERVSLDGFRHALSPPGYVEFASLAVVLFLGFPFAAFPSIAVSDGSYTNLFLHLVGYSLGYLVPYLTFAIVNPETSGIYSHTT